MVNIISPYVDDELIESNLRLFFDEDEMWDLDFKTIFQRIIDREDDLYLKLRGREFIIDKLTGDVEEI